MKILGIAGSTRKSNISGVHKLVRTVLENTGCEYDLISLKGKKISGCIACLGCVEDNICKVEDDLTEIRDKIVDADAYVIGAPNYYSGMNAITHAFMERWFQFRHRENDTLWGKLGIAIGVGGTTGQFPADEIEKFFLYNFIETVSKVTGHGAASCFSCGYGETCKVGIPYFLYGEGVKITQDMIPDVEKQPEAMQSAIDAGKLLGQRLREEHDRSKVTHNMQQKMMGTFKSSA
jgi:multimeric flavodoxin WrbA